MERIRLVDGDTKLLPKTGAVLLTIDAVAFREGFVRDLADDGSNLDAETIRASTNKLLDLVEREKVGEDESTPFPVRSTDREKRRMPRFTRWASSD